jgi:hypothetical protein
LKLKASSPSLDANDDGPNGGSHQQHGGSSSRGPLASMPDATVIGTYKNLPTKFVRFAEFLALSSFAIFFTGEYNLRLISRFIPRIEHSL